MCFYGRILVSAINYVENTNFNIHTFLGFTLFVMLGNLHSVNMEVYLITSLLLNLILDVFTWVYITPLHMYEITCQYLSLATPVHM